MKYLSRLVALSIASLSLRAATNNVPRAFDLGAITVEGAPISRYRVEQVSTATWTPVAPEEVPLSVDVLTEDFIREMNPSDLHDMLRHQAGVYTGGKTMLDRTSGQYVLRGMSGSDAMLDGTLGLAGPMGTFMEPEAFERIEISKGPVGALIGGASSTLGPYGSGGSINLVLKQPLPDAAFREIGMRVSLGDELLRFRLMFDWNRPLTEELALRVPASIDRGKPFWLPSGADWRQSWFAAPALLWRLDDSLRVGFNLTLQYTEQPGYQGIPLYRGRPLSGFDWDSHIGREDMRDRYFGLTVQPWIEWEPDSVWTLRTGAGLAQANIRFEHLGSAPFAAPDGTPFAPSYLEQPYELSRSDTTTRRYSLYQRAIADFTTGPWSHVLVVQGDLARKESDGRSFFESVPDPAAHRSWRPQDERDSVLTRFGVMAQEQARFGSLRLLGGGRFDRHESDLNNRATSFSPRGGFTFLLRDDLILFGNLSRTAAPNFGYLEGPDSELTSSWRATQYEGGLRVSPLRTLWLATSLFEIRQRNTPSMIPGSTYYETEGAGTTRGLEVSLSGNLRSNWSVYGSYAWLDYRDESQGISFDRHPPHAVTLASSWRIESGPLEKLVVGAGYRFRHRYDATMRGRYVGEDYFIEDSHVFDASLTIPLGRRGDASASHFKLAVKNLFNERYVESNRHYYQGFPGDPRTLELSFTRQF